MKRSLFEKLKSVSKGLRRDLFKSCGQVLLIDDTYAASQKVLESGRQDPIDYQEAVSWAQDPNSAPLWLKDVWRQEGRIHASRLLDEVNEAPLNQNWHYEPSLLPIQAERAWPSAGKGDSMASANWHVLGAAQSRVSRYDELIEQCEEDSDQYWALIDEKTELYGFDSNAPDAYQEFLNFGDLPLPEVFREGSRSRPELFEGQRPTDPDSALEKCRDFLVGLPYIPESLVRDPIHRYEQRGVESICFASTGSEFLHIPLERVLCGASLNNWAGRGAGTGKSGSTKIVPEWSNRSIGLIVEYSLMPFETMSPDGHIQIVRDAVGEHWGIHHIGGAHRLAAQKLRGDRHAKVERLFIPHEEHMPLLDFSVREIFSSR